MDDRPETMKRLARKLNRRIRRHHQRQASDLYEELAEHCEGLGLFDGSVSERLAEHRRRSSVEPSGAILAAINTPGPDDSAERAVELLEQEAEALR
jgi:histone H3/H4